ncbi:MAG: DUF2914 domain-containing protein [Candidatus Pacebacteria bacterium]|nr:DUF2914 domain-containing protein [Candidatus Paceibacterota bacterium]
MSFLEKTRNLYGRFERPISSLSLIGGFVFDAVTLKRVDTVWENLWVLAHLVIVAVFIALIHIKESQPGDEKDPSKAHFWFVNILQFFFGGTLSVFLVFYFRSADIFVTWPFILILALAFIANESLKSHYVRFSFQISLFFLSIYSFAIFLVPVVLHQIGPQIFLLSGFLSLIFITIFVSFLLVFVKNGLKESRKMAAFLILGIFAFVNVLYFTNLIPPIPLSLKDGGVYHSIQRNADGNYSVTYEDYGWAGYFNLYPDFNEVPGTPVYAYSAIFSPQNLNITVVHQWQYYDEAQKKWTTHATIKLPVVGGRDGGFRTYSASSNLTPGKWRVSIQTEQGQAIGTLRFNILLVATEPTLTADIKQ